MISEDWFLKPHARFGLLSEKKKRQTKRKTLLRFVRKTEQEKRALRGFRILKKSYPRVSREDTDRMQSVLYVLSCKFLTQEEKMNVKELIATDFLTQLFIEDGKVLGRVEGRAEGRVEDILDFLGDMGTVAAELSDRVTQEKDEAVLKRWLKLAARVKSIEEFEKAM